jgi:hypothetical protein
MLTKHGLSLENFNRITSHFHNFQTVEVHTDTEVLKWCWPLLQLVFQPEQNDDYLRVFLAMFEKYGQSRSWWEHISGMRKQHAAINPPLPENERTLPILDWCQSENITSHYFYAYAWAVQLFLGLNGIETSAVQSGKLVTLRHQDITVYVGPGYVGVLTLQYVLFIYLLIISHYVL